ncbi:hypothetical protein GCM10010912_57370 [Paenibacillus albidus]|uniref:Uncharacterized protein n=1 Tax=Paenibacillus albidus TaxID=2041023 RepID=A0A917FVI7_9BACL|nr:hypothetical protein GCM10010912_57370 [Paenibacillus albidus]
MKPSSPELAWDGFVQAEWDRVYTSLQLYAAGAFLFCSAYNPEVSKALKTIPSLIPVIRKRGKS